MIPASHHGDWHGVNRLFLMPGTPANVSEGTLVVTGDRVNIGWSYDGSSHMGELVLLGPSASCRGDFTDSFHMATGMQLHGYARGPELLLFGTFAAGDSPHWGWRITLDWGDSENLTMKMYTVKPDGRETMAVELRGARAGP